LLPRRVIDRLGVPFGSSDYLNGPIISIGVTFITINKDRWDEIPADLQAIMQEEALAHQVENRRLMEAVWDPAGITDNVAGGMEFVEFSQELKDALLQASIDVVIPSWVDRNGGPDSEGAKMFNEFVGPIVGVTINADGSASECCAFCYIYPGFSVRSGCSAFPMNPMACPPKSGLTPSFRPIYLIYVRRLCCGRRFNLSLFQALVLPPHFLRAAVAHQVSPATLKATPAVVSQYQAASKFFAFMRSAKHIVRPFGTQIQSPTTLVPVRSLPTTIY